MQQLKANGQLLQNSSPQDASEQTKQNEKNDTEIVEPPQKMRKVVIANVEMLVEEGSTITIGGVPVKFWIGVEYICMQYAHALLG